MLMKVLDTESNHGRAPATSRHTKQSALIVRS